MMKQTPIEDDEHPHHEELVAGLREQMAEILEKSAQPIILYLDDDHKTGNEKAAELFGFRSVKEFEKFEGNFLETFVAEKDREAVMENYHNPFSQERKATVLNITLRNTNGDEYPAQFIHVPMLYSNHLFAVSFIDLEE
jgi:PAS domain S-box-containing protein